MSIDPRTRRDLHFEARASSLKKMGLEVRSEALQQDVAKDLAFLDRVRSEGALRRKTGPKKKRTPNYTQRPDVARPELHAEALAHKAGGEFYSKPVGNDVEAKGEVLTGVEAQRTAAMQRRLQHLSTRGPGRLRANQTVEQGPFMYPKFVADICSVAFSYDSQMGIFRGKSAEDRRRILRRKLEDICNRSDAVVGVSWWVK